MSGFVTGLIQSYGQGWLQDKANGYAEEHFQPTKDPYYQELPSGKKVRRRLPEHCSKQESKAWKKLQNKAWSHDKGICGSCCWSQCIGWAPLLAILPIIGPAVMYSIHAKMIDRAKIQYDLPRELVVKMHGNIGLDLAIALVPVLGIAFSWMNACSTRNAAMIYNYISQRAVDAHNEKMKEKAGIADTKQNEKLEAAEAKKNAKASKASKNSKASKSEPSTATDAVASGTVLPASAPAATSNTKTPKFSRQETQPAQPPPPRTVPNTPSPFQNSVSQPYSRPAEPVPPPSTAMPSSKFGSNQAVAYGNGGNNPYVAQTSNQSYPMQSWNQVSY